MRLRLRLAHALAISATLGALVAVAPYPERGLQLVASDHPLVSQAGAQVLARGGTYEHLEGKGYFQRHVVVEFPTFEQAVACHASPEYQEARKFRLNGVGDNELVIVEGGDATPK